MKSTEIVKSTEAKLNSCDAPAASDLGVDNDRREAIGKIGKFAAYTAPVMLAMLTGEAKAQAGSPPPG